MTIHATADDRAAAEFVASEVVYFEMNARVEELEPTPQIPTTEKLDEHAKEVENREGRLEALEKAAARIKRSR